MKDQVVVLNKQICFHCADRMRHITRAKKSFHKSKDGFARKGSNITFKKDWKDGYVTCFAAYKDHPEWAGESELSIYGGPTSSCLYIMEHLMSAEARGVRFH